LAQKGDGEAGGERGEGQQAIRIEMKRRGNLFLVTWGQGTYSPHQSEGIGTVEPNSMEAVMKPSSGSGAHWVLRGWPETKDAIPSNGATDAS
jgi:hypothetical protein